MSILDTLITIRPSNDAPSIVPCPNCMAAGHYYEYLKDKQNKVRQYRIECSWCGGKGVISDRR